MPVRPRLLDPICSRRETPDRVMGAPPSSGYMRQILAVEVLGKRVRST